MDSVFINILNGISFSMLLFLIAAGFSLIYGVMGILNLAHGALYMVGAYFALTVIESGIDTWFLILISGGMGAALVGLLLERFLFRHLYKQIDNQVLLSVGVVYILANLTLWLCGPFLKLGSPPPFLDGAIPIGSLSFPIYRLFLIAIGTVICAILWFLQDKTKVGAIIRAGMDDKQMTSGLGINYQTISASVFIFGAFMGGLAGAFGLPISGAYSWMAMDILLLALIVVVVGGVGRVQGTFVGALAIGIADSFGKAYIPDMALFTIYLVMVIVLIVKPSGILGRKL